MSLKRTLTAVTVVALLTSVLHISGCTSLAGRQKAISSSTSTTRAVDEVSVKLYFSSAQASRLLAETRAIVPEAQGDVALVSALIEELVTGPTQESRFKTMPEGSRLLTAEIEEGLVVLDFNREFEENSPGGSAGETMTIFSIVNTLTEFSFAEKVRFKVEGEPIETLAGHLDLTEPVARDDSLIDAGDG